jgi:hypothetical protein
MIELSEVKPQHYYLVEVERFRGNCRHRAIMATGFSLPMCKGAIADAVLWNKFYSKEQTFEWSEPPYYLRVLSEIVGM